MLKNGRVVSGGQMGKPRLLVTQFKHMNQGVIVDLYN